ncbi:MAG: hypothetical protein ACOX5R_14910 [bacterium]|jgi:hypothetical protein
MRNVSILSLVAVVALAAPVWSGTQTVGDLPDLRAGLDTPLNDVIDLSQFFGSGATDIQVTGAGATVTDGVISIPGSTEAGVQTVTVNATVDGEAVTQDFNVYFGGPVIGGGAGIDDNDRIAGQLGGNIFYNGIVPGQTVSSVENLDLPDLGGGSPGGGSAAAIVSIAEISLNMDSSVYRREVGQTATGAGEASLGGLTVTLDSDGSYDLVTSNEFSGAYLVSFGVQVGDSVDAVSVLAASAQAVSTEQANIGGSFSPTGADATVTGDAAGLTIVAAPGQSSLVFFNNSFDVSGRTSYTLTADVTTDNAGAQVALVVFDGAVGGNVFYAQQWNENLSTSGVQGLAVTFTPVQGTAVPAVQVLNPDTNSGTANVTVSNIQLVEAGSVVDYALNPNAKADLPGIDGSVPGLDGWTPNILLVPNFAEGTFNATENHFAGQGSGSIQLAAPAVSGSDAGVSNAFAIGVNVDAGTVLAEAFVKQVGTAPAAGTSTFALVFTGTGNFDMGAFPDGAAIPTDWTLVQVSGTMSVAGQGILAVQASNGLDVVVDDISVRVVDDNDAWFDASLLQ